MNFHLSARSKARLVGVHPDLVRVVDLAIDNTPIDFCVLEGLRTKSRQKTLYEQGASMTLNSRHLTGHAVDLGAYIEGAITWAWPMYHRLASAVKQAAKDLDIPIEWGGDWKRYPDGPHWQLPWADYPL